jgi:hypothetical protein
MVGDAVVRLVGAVRLDVHGGCERYTEGVV